MTTSASCDELFAALRDELGGRVKFDAPFGAQTTYRVGGTCKYYVAVGSREDAMLVGTAVAACGLPVLVLGNGSNLLVSDAGFDGVVIHCVGELSTARFSSDAVTAGGGMSLPSLARRSVSEGRVGLEFLVGIPGTVGGAVRQNAGGHGKETAEVLRSALILDLLTGRLEHHELSWFDFAYRSSRLVSTELVIDATFHAPSGDGRAGSAILDSIVRWRRANQPGGANAGSVFVNPAGDSAGALIDRAGLKGLRRGGAVVSMKHANFIQAESGATAADVLAVMRAVSRGVEERFGVTLQPETQLVGFTDDERSPW